MLPCTNIYDFAVIFTDLHDLHAMLYRVDAPVEFGNSNCPYLQGWLTLLLGDLSVRSTHRSISQTTLLLLTLQSLGLFTSKLIFGLLVAVHLQTNRSIPYPRFDDDTCGLKWG
jgi:hypothetical protein